MLNPSLGLAFLFLGGISQEEIAVLITRSTLRYLLLIKCLMGSLRCYWLVSVVWLERCDLNGEQGDWVGVRWIAWSTRATWSPHGYVMVWSILWSVGGVHFFWVGGQGHIELAGWYGGGGSVWKRGGRRWSPGVGWQIGTIKHALLYKACAGENGYLRTLT